MNVTGPTPQMLDWTIAALAPEPPLRGNRKARRAQWAVRRRIERRTR